MSELALGHGFCLWDYMPPTDLMERFWSKVSGPTEKGCLEFTGSRNKQGYGTIFDGTVGKAVKAHRLSAKWYLFPFQPDKCVLHVCDNPSCVNPAHLFQGGQKQNMQDAARKGRLGKSAQFGMKNPMSKLTNEQVLSIRKERGTCQQLAKKYRVSPMAISRIRAGKLWRHLK